MDTQGNQLAYLTLIAAVPPAQVDAIRLDGTFVLEPTMIKGVSHLLSYWIQVQPLGQLLNSAIDGGDRLHRDLWHPLRPPMVHHPNAVVRLTQDLSNEWRSIRESSASDDEWLASEMERLLTVMAHASDESDCIVTALDLPGDEERAQRVRIPWMSARSISFRQRRRRWWKLW